MPAAVAFVFKQQTNKYGTSIPEHDPVKYVSIYVSAIAKLDISARSRTLPGIWYFLRLP